MSGTSELRFVVPRHFLVQDAEISRLLDVCHRAEDKPHGVIIESAADVVVATLGEGAGIGDSSRRLGIASRRCLLCAGGRAPALGEQSPQGLGWSRGIPSTANAALEGNWLSVRS